MRIEGFAEFARPGADRFHGKFGRIMADTDTDPGFIFSCHRRHRESLCSPAGSGKSWTSTSSGSPGGRNSRPGIPAG